MYRYLRSKIIFLFFSPKPDQLQSCISQPLYPMHRNIKIFKHPLFALASRADQRVRAIIFARTRGARAVAGPRAGTGGSSSSSSGGQASERCLLAWGGLGWGSRCGRRVVSSGEDIVLGTVLESPLRIVGRLLVIVSAEDDVGVGVGPVQRLLGTRNTPAVRAVLRGSRLADGSGGRGAGDVAVESSHVLQSVSQRVPAKLYQCRVGYHLVCGGLSLPEPGTRALAVGAGRHLCRNLENRLQITDAVGVDGEDGEVLLPHVIGVALVGNCKTASQDLVGIDGVSSVERWDCDIPISFRAPKETRVAV